MNERRRLRLRSGPPAGSTSLSEKPAWVAGLKKYETPNPGKVTLQLIDTLIPYVALLAMMYLTMW